MFDDTLIYVGSFIISAALEAIGLDFARRASEIDTRRDFETWDIYHLMR